MGAESAVGRAGVPRGFGEEVLMSVGGEQAWRSVRAHERAAEG